MPIVESEIRLMVSAIVQSNVSIAQPHEYTDARWLNYFDPRKAYAAVAAHVGTLPSSRTEEKHTWRAYSDGLQYFLRWLAQSDGHMNWATLRLPTADLLTGFIAHLLGQRGLKPSTVNSKYLAPVRLYLSKLAEQNISGYTGDTRDFIADCREHIRAAASVKSPRPDTTTNIAPLWNPQFVRLTADQVRAVLRSINRLTRSGLRDYALLHVAFSSGLRLAELQRITLNSISQQGDVVLITVRGKRSNVDPVPISARAHADIMAWVDAYNADLPADDARRIAGDVPLWQPLLHGDNYGYIGVNKFNPLRGMSAQGLRDIIERTTRAALGDRYALAAHDTRRTAAAIAYEAGMPLPSIQKLLRHKDAAVTLRYIGQKPDFDASTLANYVQFS